MVRNGQCVKQKVGVAKVPPRRREHVASERLSESPTENSEHMYLEQIW
jgi:hypothetical protein